MSLGQRALATARFVGLSSSLEVERVGVDDYGRPLVVLVGRAGGSVWTWRENSDGVQVLQGPHGRRYVLDPNYKDEEAP